MASTLAEMVARFASTTYVLDVPEPVEYTRRMQTACNYDTFMIDAGRYPVRLTRRGFAWNPDPDVPTPGYVVNVGPDSAVVTAEATHTYQYIVNRLFTASSTQESFPDERTTLTVSVPAYLVKDGQTGPFAGSVFRQQA
ncbi:MULTISPECIES: hypothetical protein [Actinomycetes]|uniref:hypothetical protein n=1 Tax=Actinomycetes TaxID=1760 RepID=UPI00131A16A8|nr:MULTISPECIES: hypothetical protein [Actinomycetes]